MLSGGRRACAVVLLVGSLGVAGCGQEDSGVAQGRTSDAPSPSQTPRTYEPPELDRTELDANLAALSPEDRALVDHYLGARGRDRLDEGSWIVAAPLTVAEARDRLLGPGSHPLAEADLQWMGFEESAFQDWYAVPVPWAGLED